MSESQLPDSPTSDLEVLFSSPYVEHCFALTDDTPEESLAQVVQAEVEAEEPMALQIEEDSEQESDDSQPAESSYSVSPRTRDLAI